MASDLEQAFNQIGASMMTDDFAAKLLAYVFVMGGGNEAVVCHEGLSAGIFMAQRKFNVFGGEVPRAEGVALMNKYIKELESSYENGEYRAEWLSEIYKRYDLGDGCRKATKRG
jgi:hypothetical protein